MKATGRIETVTGDFQMARKKCPWAYAMAYIGPNTVKCYERKADYLAFCDELKASNPDVYRYL